MDAILFYIAHTILVAWSQVVLYDETRSPGSWYQDA